MLKLYAPAVYQSPDMDHPEITDQVFSSYGEAIGYFDVRVKVIWPAPWFKLMGVDFDNSAE